MQLEHKLRLCVRVFCGYAGPLVEQMINFRCSDRHDLFFYCILAAAMLFRFFPFGIAYYPYSDDYNAYGLFYFLMRDGRTPIDLYIQYGMYTARPLAGLLDVLLIAPLWNYMWLVLLLMTVLHIATLPLLEAVFKRCGLPWGRAASLVFGLYPLLTEGTYWVNAASRVIPGFFFLVVSAYYLTGFFKKRRNICFVAAGVFTVLSMGFYEQTVTLGFALFLIIIWSYREKLSKIWFAFPVVYAGCTGLYYYAFINYGRMASRSAIAELPLQQISDALRNIWRLLFTEQRYNILLLVERELPRFFQSTSFIIIFSICVVFSLLSAYSLHNDKIVAYRKPLTIIICIVLLFFSAFGPFFILRDSNLSLRNIFFCVPAVAMLVQWIWDAAQKNHLGKNIFTCAAGLTVCAFMLFNISSVNAVRVNYRSDNAVAENILASLNPPPAEYRKVWLFGARYQYQPHGGVNLQSSTLSDWALTGLVDTLAFERYGMRYSVGYYHFNTVIAGRRYNLDIIPHEDLLLAVDRDMSVRKLELYSDILFYAETGEEYGVLDIEDEKFVLTIR